MDIRKEIIQSEAIRLSVKDGESEVGRAFLFIITNELHDAPYGLMEDVYVESDYRGKGHGTQLVGMMIEEAKVRGCYKLIGQSRYGREKVHDLYVRLGFKDHGKNFRMDLN